MVVFLYDLINFHGLLITHWWYASFLCTAIRQCICKMYKYGYSYYTSVSMDIWSLKCLPLCCRLPFPSLEAPRKLWLLQSVSPVFVTVVLSIRFFMERYSSLARSSFTIPHCTGACNVVYLSWNKSDITYIFMSQEWRKSRSRSW